MRHHLHWERQIHHRLEAARGTWVSRIHEPFLLKYRIWNGKICLSSRLSKGMGSVPLHGLYVSSYKMTIPTSPESDTE